MLLNKPKFITTKGFFFFPFCFSLEGTNYSCVELAAYSRPVSFCAFPASNPAAFAFTLCAAELNDFNLWSSKRRPRSNMIDLPWEGQSKASGFPLRCLLHSFDSFDKLPAFVLPELWKGVKLKVAQSCLTLQPHGLNSPWNSPEYWSG